MGVTAKAEILLTLAYGSISSTYTAIGTTLNAISIIEFDNLTNATVFFLLMG